jgi:hypothetical protein
VISIAILNLAVAVSCMALSACLLCWALAPLWQAFPAARVFDRQADRNSLPAFMDEN